MSAPNLKVVKYPSVRDFLQWLRSKPQHNETNFMAELQGRIVDVEVFAEGSDEGIHFELHDVEEGAYFISCFVSPANANVVLTTDMEGLLMKIWGEFEGKGKVNIQRIEEVVPVIEPEVPKPQIIIASVPYLQEHKQQVLPVKDEQYMLIRKLRLYLTAFLIIMIILLLVRLGQ